MKYLLARETRLLMRSSTLLAYRRLNWCIETNHRVRYEFEAVVREARLHGFLFDLHVSQFETPNEEVVQLSAAQKLIGAVNRNTSTGCEGVMYDDTPIIEEGGILMASQSITGHIHFIVHPRSSERLRPCKKDIFLFRPYDPTEVTPRLVRQVIRRYLLILRSSSVYGIDDAISLRERMLLVWIRVQDIRYKHRVLRSLISLQNEWGKVIATGAVALVVGYLLGRT